MNYSDPIITAYINLVKANTGVFVKYFQGDPLRIAASELPCLIVSKSGTQAGVFNNAQDQHAISLTLTVVADVRQDFSSDDSNVTAGIATLYDIVEGRNSDYTLKDTSILDILRSNILVDAAHNLRTDLGTITRVDYGQTLRGRAKDMWSIEAQVQFTAHFIQVR